ncbi:protein YgfX [Nitrosomonas sp.]|uniref:protein YgfX n=1 Tax=Nitrosomonas sp. TaxID=42353 RepID=UPI0026146A98|nr:protein YgfX [Nitrosomonas sp.]
MGYTNNQSMNALSIQLHSSRQLAVLLSLAHCTAAGVFWPLTLPVMIKIAISLVLAGSLYYYLHRYAWLVSPQSAVELHLSEKNRCKIRFLSGERINTVIDASTFVASYMTVLCLRLEHTGQYRTVVILPDGIDADSFRRLRVWLRWKWQNEPGNREKQG